MTEHSSRPAATAYAVPDSERTAMMANVVQAVGMVRGLPQYAAQDSRTVLPDLVRVACLEAFFVNVRLLAEFLTRPAKRGDFSASEFVNGWQPRPPEEAERLGTKWLLASQHVVHLSRERIPKDVSKVEYEDTSLAGLQAIVADCDAVWHQFEIYAGVYLPPAAGPGSPGFGPASS